MNLIDIHCHLSHSRFSQDLDRVIERARNAGVKSIVTSGVNSSTNRMILKIMEKYPDIVKCSFGIYPIDALASEIENGEAEGFVRDAEEFDLSKELEWIQKNKDKCVAIGECGLDYKFVKKEKQQKKIFSSVVELAEKISKPVIIHSRKAESDAIEILESTNLKVVLHCFNGRKYLIKKAVELGFYFSIPPIITRLHHFQLMSEIIPLKQLLTETDAPYLSPKPGERNESANVKITVQEIAKIKSLSPKEVAEQIWENYKKIFKK
jgi:TatD DNase family protein